MSLVRIALLGLAMTFVGCTQVNTQWNLDSQGDLAGRRTFSLNTQDTEPSDFSGADLETWKSRQTMLRGLILTELTAKGYRHTSSSPDFFVNYAAGVDLGSGAFSDMGGERKGEIDIHAVDPASKRWLWHGWASETITAKLDRDQAIREAVSQILAKFPPAS